MRTSRFSFTPVWRTLALASLVFVAGCGSPPRPQPNLLKVPSAVDLPATLVVLVREAGSHQPIPFAAIAVKGRQVGGMTDRSGTSVIPNLQPGRVALHTTMLGFEASDDSLVVRAGRRDTIGVTMYPAPLMPDPRLYEYPKPPPRSASPDVVEI